MAAPQITPLPTPPVRSDAPADFSSKADAFVASLPGFVTQANAQADFNDQRAIDADASATAAAASEAAAEVDRAEVAANTATVASNTATVVARADEVAANTLQVAADTQQVSDDKAAVDAALASIAGGPVYSVNGMTGDVTGIATQAGAETLTNKTVVDPVVTLGGSQGEAGQVPVSQGAGLPPVWGGVTPGYLHVRDQKAAGSQGGTSVTGLQTRTLNTVVTNTIPGASLASNLITLPAGTYRISAVVPGVFFAHRASFYNVTASATAVQGVIGGSSSSQSPGTAANSLIQGRFTLLAVSQLRVDHYFYTGIASYGLGDQIADGNPAVFTDVQIWKEA